MSKSRFWILTVAALVLAATAGYFGWRTLRPAALSARCPHSTVADLAIPVTKDPAVRKKIEDLDARYTAAFNQTCGQLCQERIRLSERFSLASADDPEAAGLLTDITRLQSEIEVLTWKHLLAVRDALSEPERTEFLRNVQAHWLAGQRQMQKSMAGNHQCPMGRGK